jgi:ZIP family zinc transporter
MFNWFINLNYVYQALIATLFTYFLTALGASLVFFFKKISKNIMDAMLGFAAGVMISASFFSLLSPAIEHANSLNMTPWIIISLGFLSGGFLLFISDKIFNKLLNKKNKRIIMLLSSITIHNIPEGLAVGLAFGLVFTGAENADALLMSALMLALGMGLQNFPEGAAVSLPMMEELKSKPKAFLYGTLTGIVEPIAAVVGIFLSMYIQGIMPWALAFAAGCMIYVTVEELIPEAQLDNKNHLGTWSCIAGFLVMMVLDIALAF